ncbi:hypothetical protein [Paenibacillus popilliae]|uniref:FOG: TPR repeat n=1 Tax=Paenibacillus popilliae ATCC 14706 TaxID=1212764 RepID=M9LRD5_PAEPP|nr:hypothetical protein [Paenibacillus popilliae]GAC43896.1 FOG: TPR repeat [Paenibacillus popilliae ATCC 14706]
MAENREDLQLEKERTGLRICSEKNVDIVLKRAFVHFAKWLRNNYNFPKRVPVYVKRSYYIVDKFTKEQVSASFCAVYCILKMPRIAA